jgi:hypothetical protein
MVVWSLPVPISSISQRSKRIMAQTSDEIAKDIMVAWLGHHPVPTSTNAANVGQYITTVYKAVLQAVREGMPPQPDTQPMVPLGVPKQPE